MFQGKKISISSVLFFVMAPMLVDVVFTSSKSSFVNFISSFRLLFSLSTTVKRIFRFSISPNKPRSLPNLAFISWNLANVSQQWLPLWQSSSLCEPLLRWHFWPSIQWRSSVNKPIVICKTNLLPEKNKRVICRLRVSPYGERLWPWACRSFSPYGPPSPQITYLCYIY